MSGGRAMGCSGPLMRLLRDIGRQNSGVAAIEFALVAMAFLILVAGTVDVGNLIYTEARIDAAIAAGAEYAAANAASVNSSSGSGLAGTIATAMANANGANWASSGVCINNGPTATANAGTAPTCSGTASNADSSYCPTGSPPSWIWGSAMTAGTSCGAGGGIAGKFVAITASRNFTPLFPALGLVPNGTISQSALVETQ